MKILLIIIFMLTVPFHAIADNSMMFQFESDRANSELQCPSSRIDTVSSLGARFYRCVTGQAYTVKFFINEKEGSEKVEDIKLIWNDWFIDSEFGIHADKKEASAFVKAFSRLYAPKHEKQLMAAFFGTSKVSIKTDSCTIEYSYSRGQKIDERLLVLKPNYISNEQAGITSNSANKADAVDEINSKTVITADVGDGIKSQRQPSAFTNDSNEIKQVERRLNENKNRLKRYYATVEQLDQSKLDVAFLEKAKENWLTIAKSEEEITLGQKAFALLPRAAQQTRELFASSVEHVLVKNGMDIKAIALGKEKKQLHIVYSLMSKPLVYKFQNEIKLDEQAEKVGFTKLVYDNGFESALGQTWIIDL